VIILTFVVDANLYYFVASDGRRGDIVRCRTLQPPVVDENDYFYYLWAETIQGYFVLRQQFLEGQAQDWLLRAEVEVEERGPWVFDEMSGWLQEMIESGDPL
jgi:hypothetical protein